LFPFLDHCNYSRGTKNGVLIISSAQARLRLGSGSAQAKLRLLNLQLRLKQQPLRSKHGNGNCSCRDSDVVFPVTGHNFKLRGTIDPGMEQNNDENENINVLYSDANRSPELEARCSHVRQSLIDILHADVLQVSEDLTLLAGI
jgi:hypothetical protein